jgi:hypothetical protein
MERCSVFLYFLSFIFIASACTSVPAHETPAVEDVARVHTNVPNTIVTAASLTETVTPSPTPVAEELSTPTPELTSMPTQTPVEINVPTMQNVPILAGSNAPGIRVLEQPVAIVRDGITLAVEQVVVFSDYIELVYTVRDIPHAILFDPFTDDTAFACGGPASYPNLVLSDGTVIYPESYLLDGKAFGLNEAYARSYLIHIYKADVPAQVSEMKLVLDCLELAGLDRSPRNWEVPFHIVPNG